jgi:glycosyltransferase involved in cell wall biosynthesis
MSRKTFNILFVSELPPPLHGVSMMNQQSFNVLFNDQRFKVSLIKTKFLQFNFHRFKVLLRGLHFVTVLFKLCFTLLFKNIDVAYTNLSPCGRQFYIDIIFCWILSSIFRVKVIVHIHGIGMNKNKSQIINKLLRPLFKKLNFIHLSDKFIKELLPLADRDNIDIISNGLPAIASRSNKDFSNKTVTFYSNICQQKGIFIFLDLMKSLKNYTGLSFYIAGAYMDGIAKNKLLEYLDDEELEERLVITGPIKSNKEKDKLLSATTILVHPTYNDALPLVLIEALDYGIAVISTDVGAISDIIECNENGFICDKGDLESIIVRVKELLVSESKLKKIYQNNFDKFDKLFNSKLYKEKMVKVFEKVLKIDSI